MYAGIGCGFILSELATSYAVDAVVATLVFTLLVSKSSVRSSVQLMFAMGFGVFIYAPAMLNGYIFDTPSRCSILLLYQRSPFCCSLMI